MPNVRIDLRNHLANIGTAWINGPDDEKLPYLVAYMISRERLTNETVEYLFRVDCVAETLVEAMGLADALKDYEGWPWPVINDAEKDEYLPPADGGDVVHVMAVHLRLHGPN